MASFKLRLKGVKNNRRNPWINCSNKLKIKFAGEWYKRRASVLLWKKFESLGGNSGLFWLLMRFLN